MDIETANKIGWLGGVILGAAVAAVILLAFCMACGSLAKRPLTRQTQWWIFGIATSLILLFNIARK